jgi:hypothetical protein
MVWDAPEELRGVEKILCSPAEMLCIAPEILRGAPEELCIAPEILRGAPEEVCSASAETT